MRQTIVDGTQKRNQQLLNRANEQFEPERESDQSLIESSLRVGAAGFNWLLSEGYGLRGADSTFRMNDPQSLEVVDSVPIQYRKELTDSKSIYDLRERANQINGMYEAEQNLNARLGKIGTFFAVGAASIADPTNVIGGTLFYKLNKAAKLFDRASKWEKAGIIAVQSSIENTIAEGVIQKTGLREYKENLPVAAAAGFLLGGSISYAAMSLDNASLKIQKQQIKDYMEGDVNMNTSPKEAMIQIDKIENISKITPIKSKLTTVLDWLSGGRSKATASPSRIATNKGGAVSVEASNLETPIYRSQDEYGNVIDQSAENATDSLYRQKENLMRTVYKSQQEFNKINEARLENNEPPLTEIEFEEAVMKVYREQEIKYKRIKENVRAELVDQAKVDELYDQVHSMKKEWQEEGYEFTPEEKIEIETEYRYLENEFVIDETIKRGGTELTDVNPLNDAVTNKFNYYKQVHKDMLDAGMKEARGYDPNFYSHIEYDEMAMVANPEVAKAALERAIRNSAEYKSEVLRLEKEIDELRANGSDTKEIDKIQEEIDSLIKPGTNPKYEGNNEEEAFSFYINQQFGSKAVVTHPTPNHYNVEMGKDSFVISANSDNTWNVDTSDMSQGSGRGKKAYDAIFDFIDTMGGKYEERGLQGRNVDKLPINIISWLADNPNSKIFSTDTNQHMHDLLTDLDKRLLDDGYDIVDLPYTKLRDVAKKLGVDYSLGNRSLNILKITFAKVRAGDKDIFNVADFFEVAEQLEIRKQKLIDNRVKKLERINSELADKTLELIALKQRPKQQADGTVMNMERRGKNSLRDEMDEYSLVDGEKDPDVLMGRKLTIDQGMMQESGFMLEPLDAMARYDYKVRGKIATMQGVGFQKLSEYRDYLGTVQGLNADDVDMLVDMFRSVQGTKQLSQDPNSARNLLLRGATNYNYITMGGQFGVYGVAEVAAGIMRSGWRYMNQLVPSMGIVSDMYRGKNLSTNSMDLITLSDGTDILERMNKSRQGDSYNPDELFNGAPTTFGEKIAHGLSDLSRGFYKWSGLEGITTVTKVMIPNALSQRIFREYKLNPNIVANDLQRFGFSSDFIKEVMNQPITVGKNGEVLEFNFGDWKPEVAAKYKRFMSRAVRETIISVDGTRLPMWMTDQSTNALFLLAKQFMSFSAVAHERLLLAGMNERAAMSAVGMVVSAGILGTFQLASQELAVEIGTLRPEDRRFDMTTEEGRGRFFSYIGTRQSFSGNFGQFWDFYNDITDPGQAVAATTTIAGGVTMSRLLQTKRAIESAASGDFGTKNQTSVVKGLIPYNNVAPMDYTFKHLMRSSIEKDY